MSRVKALLLDLNNVGEDYDRYSQRLPSIVARVAARAGELFLLDGQAIQNEVSRYNTFSRRVPFQHHPGLWQHAVERATRRSLTFEEIRGLYAAYLEEYAANITAFPDFVDVVSAGRRRGLSLGLVANGNTERIYRFLEKFGLRPLFDTVVTSGSTPFAKPGRELFELALMSLGGLPPPSAVFVGDRLDDDIAGANAVGMWSVLLDRRCEARSDRATGAATPDFSVTTLGELLELPLFSLRMPVDTAVLPCGGRGARMGALTNERQKCTLEVGGEPLVKRLVRRLEAFGISTFHLLLGYRGDDVVNCFSGYDGSSRIRFHDIQAASTGAAVAAIKSELPAEFLYCHGNILVSPFVVGDLLKRHSLARATTFIVTSKRVASTHPVVLLRDGSPVDILRRPEEGRADFVYSLGLAVLLKEDLPDTSDFGDGDLTTEQLFAERVARVRVRQYEGPWIHLESPADLYKRKAPLESEEHLWPD